MTKDQLDTHLNGVKNAILYPSFRNHNMPTIFFLSFQQLGEIMHNIEPTFDKRSCRYTIERGRESTARVVVWREFDVPRSYTLEASFSGCSLGQLQVRNQFDSLTL